MIVERVARQPSRAIPRNPRRITLAVLLVLLLPGCAATERTGSSGPTTGVPTAVPAQPPTTTAPSRPPSGQPITQESTTVTAIRITVAHRTFSAQLADNPTAQDLVDQLPLTLSFRDFNSVEKIAELPRPLTTDGVPAGADPDINDIGYYAPSGDLVFYYGDVGFWNGIVRIGSMDSMDMTVIEAQQDGFAVTIERA